MRHQDYGFHCMIRAASRDFHHIQFERMYFHHSISRWTWLVWPMYVFKTMDHYKLVCNHSSKKVEIFHTGKRDSPLFLSRKISSSFLFLPNKVAKIKNNSKTVGHVAEAKTTSGRRWNNAHMSKHTQRMNKQDLHYLAKGPKRNHLFPVPTNKR